MSIPAIFVIASLVLLFLAYKILWSRIRFINYFFSFLLVITAILLVIAAIKYVSPVAGNQVVLHGNKIIEIAVAKSTGFAKVNPNAFITFRDEKAFEVFVNAVEGAKKFDGIVDIIEPEYDVGILFDNKKRKGYHLWLRGEEGTMMNVEDTHTAYKISKESTNQLKKILFK